MIPALPNSQSCKDEKKRKAEKRRENLSFLCKNLLKSEIPVTGIYPSIHMYHLYFVACFLRDGLRKGQDIIAYDFIFHFKKLKVK